MPSFTIKHMAPFSTNASAVQIVFFHFKSNEILGITIIQNFKLNQIVSTFSKVTISKYLLSGFNSFVALCLWVVL